MAPTKVPKKAIVPLKEKPIEKPIMKTKKKKRNYESFGIYIYKVLRSIEVGEEMGISKKTMLIMNNFVNDMLENIATEAGRLVAHGKKTTLTSKDIQAAIKLLIPGELALHANVQGMQAIRLYQRSREQN